MPRTVRTGMLFAAFTIALMQIPLGSAQQPSTAAAPVPSQILNARKVFISNATGELMLAKGEANTTYDDFYGAMKSWGHYELVSAPVDADLVLEIHFTVGLAPIFITNGQESQVKAMQFRAVFLDPKTHVTLWEITQLVAGANRPETGRKNFAQAMARFVESVKKLSGQPVATADSTRK